MTKDEFAALIATITEAIDGLPVEQSLEAVLTEKFPPDGEVFGQVLQACTDAITDGWMCQHGDPELKWGRVLKPTPQTHGFSVDVVDMTEVVGPHHVHPKGEVDMVLPLSEGAQFDGYGRGWCVYPPMSAHNPTVTGGQAIVLYLLPDGAIEFTGA